MSAAEYWDASAIVKLIVREGESEAVGAAFERADRVLTSRVGLVEVARVAERQAATDPLRLADVVAGLEVVELDEPISARAGALRPVMLRALDAIHLASVLELGSDLEAFVTYDARLAAAARDLGLPVVSPA